MAHNHTVTDADKHFIIDSATRAINNAEMKKTILMQNDHNSEIFSFEIDKFIEGHYPMLCNRVEIHYLNVDSSKGDKNAGVYEVTDMHIDPENEGKLVFTWLISENATFYAGSLSFLVMFSCVENGKVLYRWSTDINTSISVSKGMNNGEEIEKLYPDVLAQWKAGVDDITAAMVKKSDEFAKTLTEKTEEFTKTLTERNYAYEGAVKQGFQGTEEEWYEVMMSYEAAGHDHDDRYYTEVEVDEKLVDFEKEIRDDLGIGKNYLVTLSADGWMGSEGSEGPYRQTVSVPGLILSDIPIIDVVQSLDAAVAVSEVESWGCVSRIDVHDDAITATCYKYKPISSINLQMKVSSGVIYNTELPLEGWSDSLPYSQTVPVPGLLAGDTPIIDIYQSDDLDVAKQEILEWCRISKLETINGSLTATCYDNKPACDLRLQMKVMR